MKRRLSCYLWGGNGESPHKAPQRTCSNPGHKDTPATIYCSECLSFFCKECESHHAFMFPSHASFVCTDLSLENVFIGKCPSHPGCMLDYLCRTHNALCCDKCKLDKDGAHSKCDVVLIEKTMRDELPYIITSLQEKIQSVKVNKLEDLKAKQKVLEEDVETTKKSIKDTFNELRKILNEREVELLNNVDKLYDEYNKVEMIMEIEGSNEAENVLGNLNRMKKGNVLKKLNDRNVVNCICETKNVIKELDKTNKMIESTLELKSEIHFDWDKGIIEELRGFGTIPKKEEFVFDWKKCPDCVDERRKYSVDKKSPRIVTKIDGGYDGLYCTIIGNTALPLNTVISWSIKILKSKDNNGNGVWVGVAPSDIDQNEKCNYNKCGWYFYCYGSRIWSGPPHNYVGKEHGPRKGDGKYVHTGDSVGVVMDTSKGELSFVLNGVNLGVAYEGIPLDKPLVPCVLLWYENDSVELVSTAKYSSSQPPTERWCSIQ